MLKYLTIASLCFSLVMFSDIANAQQNYTQELKDKQRKEMNCKMKILADKGRESTLMYDRTIDKDMCYIQCDKFAANNFQNLKKDYARLEWLCLFDDDEVFRYDLLNNRAMTSFDDGIDSGEE